MNVLFCTGEMQIGKHRWRCRVETSASYGAVTNYQWFDNYLGFWRDAERWPRYNHYDSYCGLPKTLVNLYRKYEREIHEALIRGEEQWLRDHPEEPELFTKQVRDNLQQNREALAKLPHQPTLIQEV